MVSKTLDPIFLILCILFRRTIGRITVQQLTQRAKHILLTRPPLHQRRINFSYPPRNEGQTKPVHHDVMITLIPHKPVRPQLDQCITEQRPNSEVHRPGHVSGHPRLRSRVRVRFLADIHDRHHPLRQRLDNLPRPIAAPDEPDMQRVDLRRHPPQRCLEQHRINRPIYLDTLTNLVNPIRRVQLLFGKPNLTLSSRQRKNNTIATRQCRPPCLLSCVKRRINGADKQHARQ